MKGFILYELQLRTDMIHSAVTALNVTWSHGSDLLDFRYQKEWILRYVYKTK